MEVAVAVKMGRNFITHKNHLRLPSVRSGCLIPKPCTTLRNTRLDFGDGSRRNGRWVITSLQTTRICELQKTHKELRATTCRAKRVVAEQEQPVKMLPKSATIDLPKSPLARGLASSKSPKRWQ